MILVTDEMVEAGLRELDTSYDKRSDEDVVKAIYTRMHQARQSADDVERLREKLRGLSFSLAAGSADDEADLLKLIERVEWGVEHIQHVEARRAADVVEELSKSPRTTWGQVKTAILKRAGVGRRTRPNSSQMTPEGPCHPIR